MKKTILLLGVIAPAVAFGFKTADYRSAGEKLIQHRKGEICVLPSIPEIGNFKYSKKDAKNDAALCELDHYSNNAVCEKLFSTFPGIEYFNVAQGESKSGLERRCSKKGNEKTKLDKVAKYKYGTSCARTASILGYYHTARILGISSVPNTVIRTMDKSYHITRAKKGASKAAIPKRDLLIAQTWRGALSTLGKAPSSKRGKYVLSQDSSHSFGALSSNPQGEYYYGTPFYTSKRNDAGVKFLKSNSAPIQDISRSSSVASIVGTSLNSNSYQRIQQMKDAADMIVLDTIFGQKDRIGNLHYYPTFLYSKDGNSLDTISLKKVLKEASNKSSAFKTEVLAIKKKYNSPNKRSKLGKRARRDVLVKLAKEYMGQTYGSYGYAKRMVMKDNDCGLKNENHWKNNKVIEKVNHISHKTYSQLMDLYRFINTDSTANDYMRVELTMNDNEISQFKSGLNYVAKVLNRKCKSGELKTDLNIKSHFLGSNTKTCDSAGTIDTSISTPVLPTHKAGDSLIVVDSKNVRSKLVLLEEEGLTSASKINAKTSPGDKLMLIQKHKVGGYTFYEMIVESSQGPLKKFQGEIVFVYDQAF